MDPSPAKRPETLPPLQRMVTVVGVTNSGYRPGMEVVVHRSGEEATEAVAQLVAAQIREREQGFTLGLAGGSTPEGAYRHLRDLSVPWSGVEVWLSDERWVPPDHPRSNGRMAAEALMDHVEARFHRPRWSELLGPDDSAAHYEALIRSIHPDRGPDLVLLGMGEDGHTASLFPGTTALEEDQRWIVANEVPALSETRITVTYPLLWQAALLVVMAVGESKAEAVAQSMTGMTPAGLLGEGDARVEWHLDQAAAAGLG